MEKKSVELEEEEFGADARQAVFSTHSETLWGVVLHCGVGWAEALAATGRFVQIAAARFAEVGLGDPLLVLDSLHVIQGATLKAFYDEVEAAGIVGAMGGKGFVVGLDKVEAVLRKDLPRQVQKRLEARANDPANVQ